MQLTRSLGGREGGLVTRGDDGIGEGALLCSSCIRRGVDESSCYLLDTGCSRRVRVLARGVSRMRSAVTGGRMVLSGSGS